MARSDFVIIVQAPTAPTSPTPTFLTVDGTPGVFARDSHGALPYFRTRWGLLDFFARHPGEQAQLRLSTARSLWPEMEVTHVALAS